MEKELRMEAPSKLMLSKLPEAGCAGSHNTVTQFPIVAPFRWRIGIRKKVKSAQTLFAHGAPQ
jgi:hypothetical protein